MKLLNLCCGNCRPQSTPEVEFLNVDNLHATLLPGTPERENLDREENYYNADVLDENGIPADWAETFDGVICSHAVEHWTCQEAVYVMKQCRCLLKPGGILLVSVPDASYFRQVYDRDTVENAVELFGEPIHLPDGENTFFRYGLWNRWHKAILTEDALWAYFVRAGFWGIGRLNTKSLATISNEDRILFEGEVLSKMTPLLNRLPFSLVMVGVKE